MRVSSAMKRILVVDDDETLREMVVEYLGASGFQVEGARDGAILRDSPSEGAFDLLILDLMLPGEDGLSLLRRVRERRGPPVIVVSARGDEVDRVVGLEMGADDYLAKPFGPRELLARVRAVLRRSGDCAPESPCLSFGPFRLHLHNRVLTRDGIEVPLTAGEFDLLHAFLEHPGQTLSRDRLVGLLKGYDRSPFDRSIDVRVTRLRRKIETRPDAPAYLRTVWGEGYLFAPEGEDAV